ncbi:MAG TPA: DUF5132 domain-containing protein [Bryobacteraceae bacterium]|nr:DUF5132 domain-containing protein [Bryobacteraceae bacterium]
MGKNKSKKNKGNTESGGSHAQTSGRNGVVPFLWGAASAAAVILAAPLLRPAATGAVKAGIRLGRRAQKLGSAVKEEFEDITAEARAQLDREEADDIEEEDSDEPRVS